MSNLPQLIDLIDLNTSTCYYQYFPSTPSLHHSVCTRSTRGQDGTAAGCVEEGLG